MDEKNNYRNYIWIAKDILIPAVIYILLYAAANSIITSILFGAVREMTTQGKWNNICSVIVSYEMTVRGVISGISMLIGILPLLPVFVKERKKEQESGRCHARGASVSIPLTVLLAAASSITINILFIKLQVLEQSETYADVAQKQYGVVFFLGIILYGIVSPLAEEIVFRGIVYNRIKRYFAVPLAVLLSALMFGMYHGNLVQGVYGLLMGILIAYIYEKSGDFFHAFLFHAAANAVVYTVTSYESIYRLVMTPYCGAVCALFSIAVTGIIVRLYCTKV